VEVHVTLARRVCAMIDVDDAGRVARRFLKGGMEVGFVEAIAAQLAADGADEVWVRLQKKGSRGSPALYDTFKALETRVFVPLVAWAPITSPADARLLLSFGADRCVVDVNLGLPDPLAHVARVAQAVGADRVTAAVHVRRVVKGKGVAWELTDQNGEGTGKNALALIDDLVVAGAAEILLVPSLRAPDSDRVVHDGELIETVTASMQVPVLSLGDDHDAADLATAFLMGADGVVSATLFASGSPTVDEAKRSLHSFGVSVRPARA
jgi:imidazole glycerol phosphate synthase subunit HisF